MQTASARPDTWADRASDRFDPIVVKEVRQSLRSRLFVNAFLALQLAMVLAVAWELYAIRHLASTPLVWLVIGIPLLVVLPFAGWASVRHEMRGRKHELIAVTGRGYRSVLAGKWHAAMAQASLMIVSIIPYLVVRYYFGRVEPGTEWLTFCAIVLCSMSILAYAIGLSPYSWIEYFGIVCLAATIFGPWLAVCAYFSHLLVEYCGALGLYLGVPLLLLVLFVLPTSWLALDAGMIRLRET